MANTASPISITPTATNPYGLDGNWTAFRLQVGATRPQQFSVLVSTSQAVNYVVLPNGCGTQRGCALSRGGLFSQGSSSSFQYIASTPEDSMAYFPTDSALLGDNVAVSFGYDVIGLGDAGYTGIGKHLIGGMVDYQLWVGFMGILPIPTVLGGVKSTANHNSIIQDLKNQSKIPSLSWGYTGGANYQLNYQGPLGSLTLGGYDRNRFVSNEVSFPINQDNNYQKYLSVYIQSIKASTNKVTRREMLSEPIYAELDSTVSYIYLPSDACDEFESVFNLKWDHETQFYYIGDAVRKSLLAQKPAPSVTFTVSPDMNGGQSVDITLPYPAFDLMLFPPYIVSKPTYYFPLKRASGSAYALGKTFFQEAYVIADFERNNFSISQCYFGVDQGQDIVAIPSTETPTITHPQQSDSGGSTSAGVIAGPVVAVVVLLVLAVLGFWFWRRRKRRQAAADADEKGLPAYSDHVAEMDGYGMVRKPEKTNTELEATESGRATPVPNEYNRKQAPGASPLGSPPTGADQISPNLQGTMSEMDGSTSYANTYFELPGSAAQRRSMGPHEMNAEEPQTEQLASNMTSGPLPDLPEPSPPLDTATTTSNPLTAGMETVPPPPPPK